MFILCGLILEAGENLFRDFWSPFSISFLFFFRAYLKKKRNRPWAVPERDSARGRLYIAPHPSPQPTPAPRPIRRRRRRSSAPPEVRRRLDFRAEKKNLKKKKILFRRFYFRILFYFIFFRIRLITD